jgi:hypothetical protein
MDEVGALLRAVWTLAGGDEADEGLMAVLLVIDEKIAAIGMALEATPISN